MIIGHNEYDIWLFDFSGFFGSSLATEKKKNYDHKKPGSQFIFIHTGNGLGLVNHSPKACQYNTLSLINKVSRLQYVNNHGCIGWNGQFFI